jgi:hypothetical protein
MSQAADGDRRLGQLGLARLSAAGQGRRAHPCAYASTASATVATSATEHPRARLPSAGCRGGTSGRRASCGFHRDGWCGGAAFGTTPPRTSRLSLGCTCRTNRRRPWVGPRAGSGGRTGGCQATGPTPETPCSRCGGGPRPSGWRWPAREGGVGRAQYWPAWRCLTAYRQTKPSPTSDATTTRERWRPRGSSGTSDAFSPRSRPASSSARRSTTGTALQQGDLVTRYAEWGDMAVRFARVPAGTDMSPVLAGLPGDRCPSPHWGIVLEGAVHVVAADDTEGGHAGWGGLLLAGRAHRANGRGHRLP